MANLNDIEQQEEPTSEAGQLKDGMAIGTASVMLKGRLYAIVETTPEYIKVQAEGGMPIPMTYETIERLKDK